MNATMTKLLRHRQRKGAATGRFDLRCDKPAFHSPYFLCYLLSSNSENKVFVCLGKLGSIYRKYNFKNLYEVRALIRMLMED